MAEEFNRNPGDQGAYGYRQLPGAGTARGIEMKTLAYGVFAVAFGIVVGTLAADGTLKTMFSRTSLHPVQASIIAPKPIAPLAVKPAGALAAKPATPLAVKPAASLAVNAAQTRPLELHAAVLEAPKPLAGLKATESHVTAQPASNPFSGLKTIAVKAPALNVSNAAKIRPVHKLLARKRHFGRRRVHTRHRLHVHMKPRFINDLPDIVKAPKPVEEAKLFTFMVEGDVTVASFDASLGRIETYEGESFALNQVAIDMIPLDAYPGNLHYRCDQSWNCTLFRDGATILSAKRTK